MASPEGTTTRNTGENRVNNFVAFEGFFNRRTVAQSRRVRKPGGEIKPNSFMEREVVRQEQRTLRWPFAAPQSPQPSLSSQCCQSPSVGSSPNRVLPCVTHSSFPGDQRQQTRQSRLMDGCRTSSSNDQKVLVATSSVYSRHMDIKVSGLLDKHLSAPCNSTTDH